MRHLELGPIIPIFLFFVLFSGIVIIYREEIEKMELFGKLHTTPVPATIIPTADAHSDPDLPAPFSISSADSSVSFGNRFVYFGDGRIVDYDMQEVTDSSLTEGVLHTIPSGVDDYYAQAFIEEVAGIYHPSPHSGSVVFLDRTSNVLASDPREEYFVLLFSNALTQPLSVSNWKVADRQNRVSPVVFPEGVRPPVVSGDSDDLDDSGLHPTVTVYPGDTVIVSSGRSQSSDSFRVNKCSGYRSQFGSTVPSVKTACPAPMDEFVADGTVPFSDDVCYSIITSLPVCTSVTLIPSDVTKACRVFLSSVLTEKGCMFRHQDDPDFFVPELRLFLGSDSELWQNRSNMLYLLDENDLLVATLVYS